MNDDKQYLVTKAYRDGSSGRAVMVLAEVTEYIKRPLQSGARITIEEL
jgi:hypothetical protein